PVARRCTREHAARRGGGPVGPGVGLRSARSLGSAQMGRTPRRGRFVALALAFAGLAGALQVGGATADTVTAPATVSRQAYFTSPITQITPPLLRNGFPPATLCLVAGLGGLPQLCGPEVQDLG